MDRKKTDENRDSHDASTANQLTNSTEAREKRGSEGITMYTIYGLLHRQIVLHPHICFNRLNASQLRTGWFLLACRRLCMYHAGCQPARRGRGIPIAQGMNFHPS